MTKRKTVCLLFIFLVLYMDPVFGEGLTEQNELYSLPEEKGFIYSLQKFTGLNFLSCKFAEFAIKTGIKIKSKAKDVDIDLKIYSAWDLIKKRIKYLNVSASGLSIKKIPVSCFELTSFFPIFITKNEGKKYTVLFPVNLNGKIEINLDDVSEAINKNNSQLSEIELPIPPFGETKVLLKDINVSVDENGFIKTTLKVFSVVDPFSEPLDLLLTGNLVIRDKRLLVSDFMTVEKDIFTQDSDLEKAFSKAIEDLINPVINFHKYEKGGITIDSVDLSFFNNKIILKLSFRILPNNGNHKK